MITCNFCGQTLPETEFYPHPGSKLGYRKTCIACSRVKSRNRPSKERVFAPKGPGLAEEVFRTSSLRMVTVPDGLAVKVRTMLNLSPAEIARRLNVSPVLVKAALLQ